MPTVMTVLEARVSREQWAELERTYREVLEPNIPPQMTRSLLAQDTRDPEVWRLLGFWRGREALDAYRRSVETPGGVLLFRSVGSEPTLAISDVVRDTAGTAG